MGFGESAGTLIDSLELDYLTGISLWACQVRDDIYAATYRVSGPPYTEYLKTFRINSSGSISDTVIDSYTLGPTLATGSIIKVGEGIVAELWFERISFPDEWYRSIRTLGIDEDGNITGIIDSTQSEVGLNYLPRRPTFLHVYETIYLTVQPESVVDTGSRCVLRTISIANNGTILSSSVDEVLLDLGSNYWPTVWHLVDDVYVLAVGHTQTADGASLRTFTVSDAGNISGIFDKAVLCEDSSGRMTVNRLTNGVYATVYYNNVSGSMGLWVATFTVDGSNNITVVEKYRFDEYASSVTAPAFNTNDGELSALFTSNKSGDTRLYGLSVRVDSSGNIIDVTISDTWTSAPTGGFSMCFQTTHLITGVYGGSGAPGFIMARTYFGNIGISYQMWVEGVKLDIIDYFGVKRRFSGVEQGFTGKSPYQVSVQGTKLAWITHSGNERRRQGILMGHTGKLPNQVSIQGTKPSYIDKDGNERRISEGEALGGSILNEIPFN